MALGSRKRTSSAFSSYFSGCIRAKSTPARASGCRSARKLSSVTVGESGSSRRKGEEPHSTLFSRANRILKLDERRTGWVQFIATPSRQVERTSRRAGPKSQADERESKRGMNATLEVGRAAPSIRTLLVLGRV